MGDFPKFGHIYGIMIDFLSKRKVKGLSYLYSINHRKELVETWCVDGATIVRVA